MALSRPGAPAVRARFWSNSLKELVRVRKVQMVVEGVHSARAAMELAGKYHVQLPIIEQVNEVLFHGKSAAEAVGSLMLRDKKIENPIIPWEA